MKIKQEDDDTSEPRRTLPPLIIGAVDDKVSVVKDLWMCDIKHTVKHSA